MTTYRISDQLTAPVGLRVEHLDDPIGITERIPRLSWRLPGGSHDQRAYRIRVTAGEEVWWDSGRVESPESVLVPYAGPPLRSSQRVRWTVKVWTDRGDSAWAPPGWWETGLLERSDWVASWVEPDESGRPGTPGFRPAYHLRHELTVRAPVVRARVYVTARGIYELFVNGERVGDAQLRPGFTAYRSRMQVDVHDVTGLVREGRNAWGAILSDGWYRGKISFHRTPDCYGSTTALLAQLRLDHADGTTTVTGTDGEWRSAVGAIKAAELFDGELVDLADELTGWASAGYDAGDWRPVRVADDHGAALVGPTGPPAREVAELRPARIVDVGDHVVVDFGQNISGWVRLRNLGPAGTTLRLKHTEALVDGDVPADYGDNPFVTEQSARGEQVDVVVSAGREGQSYVPRHTTHGFRYLRIDGHPGVITEDDVTAFAVQSDTRRTGWFRCSDERVNRLHAASVWSIRSNLTEIPTDSPTRERTGWATWYLAVPTFALLYDVAGVATRWLRDVAADQRADGLLPDMAPDAVGTRPISPRGTFPPGSPGWADGGVIVPWQIYEAYGDTRLLAEQFDSMRRFVDYQLGRARSGRHPSRVKARPEPLPHEEYLLDGVFCFDEWHEPVGGLPHSFVPPSPDPDDWAAAFFAHLAERDTASFATAFLYRSTDLLSRAAEVLGREQNALRYRDLAERVRAAWQTEFIDGAGRIRPDNQSTHVRALAFDLVPADLREQAARRLVELIAEADGHVGTGLHATPFILPVLADTGHLDVAYQLLLRDTWPSWLVQVERGSTTLWEGWRGVDENGWAHDTKNTDTLNNYLHATIAAFMHAHIGGLQQVPDSAGYRRFRIAPRPGHGIHWADVVLDTPYGQIASSWRVEDTELTLSVSVPPGTTAEAVLPSGERHELPPGRWTFRARHGSATARTA